MAGDVVPLLSVVVEVVQDGQAGLVVSLGRLAVVRLRLSVSAGVAPVAVVSLAGRADLRAGSGPEPSVLVGRLQIGSVAAREIALPARGPDVADVAATDPLLHELVLLGRLQGHGVHAVTTANVSRVQPVDLQAAGRRVLPREEVRMGYASSVAVCGMADAWGEEWTEKVLR